MVLIVLPKWLHIHRNMITIDMLHCTPDTVREKQTGANLYRIKFVVVNDKLQGEGQGSIELLACII